LQNFMMSVSEEMFAWLEKERKRRHLETIQETVRSLISVHIAERRDNPKEIALWREDDDIFVTIPDHFVNHRSETGIEISFSGRVYGERGVRLLEIINRLKKDQELHRKHFSLILPGLFEGVVSFVDRIPTAKQKDDLVHFKFTVYET